MHLLHHKAKNIRWPMAMLLLFAAAFVHAETVEVKGARMWPAPESTRLVFDLSGPVNHTLFTLPNPDRVVIDVDNAVLSKPILNLDFSQGLIKGLRSAPQGTGIRFVLDLRGRARPKSFALRPNKEYGDRLVIDLDDLDKMAAGVISKPTPAGPPKPPEATRDIIVAVDAGHGGEDPGAIGPNGTREKDVVLAIARRVAAMIDEEPGMRAVLIRSGDYYVSLRNRVVKAQEQHADLFVSVHADSFRDRRARGSSVYILSRRGASSEYARLLADKENAADMIGGVSLDDKDPMVKSVILDLSQTAAIEAGNDAAGRVLRSLRQTTGVVHKNRVEQAGFMVLKAPDIPSMLVETAFISNPDEERKLRSSSYQNDIAKAIKGGVFAYFEHNPLPGTKLARSSREHVVSKGETLAGVAQNYRVSLESLRDTNGLAADATLHPGDILRIPPS